jgi:ABC-type dipeptide/oligopeptide/nickel transport system permease subunit
MASRHPVLRNIEVAVGGLILLVLVLVTLISPFITPRDPMKAFTSGLTDEGMPIGPGQEFPLGTDTLGRDLLSRLLAGTRYTLLISVSANLLALLIGGLVGLLAGFRKGWLDGVLMRLTDVMMAFPILLLAMALVAVLPPSAATVIFVLSLVMWTGVARLVRGLTLAESEKDYVLAGRALGFSAPRILLRHILPNILSPVVIYVCLNVAMTVLLEAGMSYLGVGVPPPAPDWGRMIHEGKEYFRAAPWIVAFPGMAIFITVLGFNLLGDGLRNALDPHKQSK